MHSSFQYFNIIRIICSSILFVYCLLSIYLLFWNWTRNLGRPHAQANVLLHLCSPPLDFRVSLQTNNSISPTWTLIEVSDIYTLYIIKQGLCWSFRNIAHWWDTCSWLWLVHALYLKQLVLIYTNFIANICIWSMQPLSIITRYQWMNYISQQ